VITLGAVGQNTALASLTVTAGGIQLGAVATTGAQSYTGGEGGTSVGGAYSAGQFTVQGGLILAADTTISATSGVQLQSVDGTHALTIGSAGPVTLNGFIGDAPLTTLSVAGTDISVNGAVLTQGGPVTIVSTGALTVNAPITAVGGNVLLDDTAGTGLVVNNATISALNTISDTSKGGTVTTTGPVTLNTSSLIAGTGLSVTLLGPVPPTQTSSNSSAGSGTTVANSPSNPVIQPNPPPPLPPPAIQENPPLIETSPSGGSSSASGGSPQGNPGAPPPQFSNFTAELLNQIIPQAGPGVAGADDSSPTEGDELAGLLAQPLQSNPPTQSDGKSSSAVTVVIGGLVNRLRPADNVTLPQGVSAPSSNYSNWGNEAFW
jgi:hypothetical protein